MFSRIRFSQLRKTGMCSLAVFTGWISYLGHDFHGFLWDTLFAMWILLESSARLVRHIFFLTPSSVPRRSSSQPVYDESPLSIALCTISEASTGIGYYYCIYINISLYILRRSTRQAFKQRNMQMVLIVRLDSRLESRLRSGFVECSEVRALHGPDTAHVMQAGTHTVSNAVT